MDCGADVGDSLGRLFFIVINRLGPAFGPIGGRRDKQRRSFNEFRNFILIINRMRTMRSVVTATLLDELFHVSPVRDVLEVLFAVLFLVHIQQVSGTAVSGTTLWFLELVRQFWKWNVPISLRPSSHQRFASQKIQRLTEVNSWRLSESESLRDFLQIQLTHVEDGLQLMGIVSPDERLEGFLPRLVQEVVGRQQVLKLWNEKEF